MYVLDGELMLFLPGRTVVAGPGEVVHGQMNVPHTERVGDLAGRRPAGRGRLSGRLRAIRRCRRAGRPAEELTLPPASLPAVDLEFLAQVAADHDIELLGPPGAMP
jgi:hypothetical protein